MIKNCLHLKLYLHRAKADIIEALFSEKALCNTGLATLSISGLTMFDFLLLFTTSSSLLSLRFIVFFSGFSNIDNKDTLAFELSGLKLKLRCKDGRFKKSLSVMMLSFICPERRSLKLAILGELDASSISKNGSSNSEMNPDSIDVVDSEVNILSFDEAGDDNDVIEYIEPMLESLRSCLKGFFVGVSENFKPFVGVSENFKDFVGVSENFKAFVGVSENFKAFGGVLLNFNDVEGVSVNLRDFLTEILLVAGLLAAGEVNSKFSSSKFNILVAFGFGLLKEVEVSLSEIGAPKTKFLELTFLEVEGRPLDIMSGLSVEMISYFVHSSKLSLSNSSSRSWRVSKSWSRSSVWFSGT